MNEVQRDSAKLKDMLERGGLSYLIDRLIDATREHPRYEWMAESLVRVKILADEMLGQHAINEWKRKHR